MNKMRLFASAYGHLSIDVLNASVAIILTLAAPQFGLTIAEMGLGAMLYQTMAAMSQPLFFGGLTDKLRGRWVANRRAVDSLLFCRRRLHARASFITCLMIGGLGGVAPQAWSMLPVRAAASPPPPPRRPPRSSFSAVRAAWRWGHP